MKKYVVLAVAALALAIGTGAAAAAPGNPHGTLATPAAACKVLSDPSQVLGLVLYDANFATCMRNLHSDMAAYRFPGDINTNPISLDERCTELETYFGVSYPFTFTEDEPGSPPWPIVTFTAMNHQQCEYTLWVYHFVFDHLGPPPGP